ncbi:MAG TPA: hypothetical protein VM600_08810, partial [Actinomycetota bacterium]|nr:hypothetical protein [Actinomycetota bacterium]
MSTVIEDPRIAEDISPSAPTEPDGTPQPEGTAAPQTVRAAMLDEERPLTKEQILRPAFGALSTTLGCAFLVGGMFTGITPRLYAAVGGIVGVFAAVWAARARKRVGTVQAASLFAVVFAGLLLLLIGDPGALGNLGEVLGEAAANARLRRPPAPFDDGWRMILPVTVGFIG